MPEWALCYTTLSLPRWLSSTGDISKEACDEAGIQSHGQGNCSWLPFFLWRLDEHWERLGDVHAPELTMAPSAYWKRQCFASAEADEEPVKYTIEYLGSSNGLVFSTDFPHGDSKFPASLDRFLQLDISDADKRQILWDNCAAY